MGLFKKKPDPITERAKLLNDRIAALESEIQKLASQPAKSPVAPPSSSPGPAFPSAVPALAHTQPRLRSTARPHGPTVPTAVPVAQEPIFEEVGEDRIKSQMELPAAPLNDLGVRRHDIASAWERLKNHFRGPATSNPKLVHYLSAGSIQGLRPLRYEKRVARNRVIVLAVFLVLALWGIIAVFLSRK